ncbi:MAG: hypothetical protein R3C56_24380 [Pirellulaceae bacterium]
MLLACWSPGAGIAYLVSVIGGSNVYADVPEAVKQIEQAKTVTWKQKFYERRSRNDTKEQTSATTTSNTKRVSAYKAPGLYRQVTLDENGRVGSIDINDSIGLKRLLLNPTEMKATLFHLTQPMFPANGLFADVKERLRSDNLEWLGEKEMVGARPTDFGIHPGSKGAIRT